MVVKHAKLEDSLAFENLTVCPYSRELIDVSFLQEGDKVFLNEYH